MRFLLLAHPAVLCSGAKLSMLCPSLLTFTIYISQIFEEIQIGIRYSLQIINCKIDFCVGVHNFFHSIARSTEFGQSQRCLASVSDLPSVPSHFRMSQPVCFGEFNYFWINVDVSLSLFESISD